MLTPLPHPNSARAMKGRKASQGFTAGEQSGLCLSSFPAAPRVVLRAAVPCLRCKTFPLCSEPCPGVLCQQHLQAGCCRPCLPAAASGR